MFKTGDKVQVIAADDKHYGEIAEVIKDVSTGNAFAHEYELKMSSGETLLYTEDEIIPLYAEADTPSVGAIDVKETMTGTGEPIEEETVEDAIESLKRELAERKVVSSTAQDRRASYERALYAEDLARSWEAYINGTNTSGMNESIKIMYSLIMASIDDLIKLEMEASR